MVLAVGIPRAHSTMFLQMPATVSFRERKPTSDLAAQSLDLGLGSSSVSRPDPPAQHSLTGLLSCSPYSLLNSASDNIFHNYRLGLIPLIVKGRIFKKLCNICIVTHPGNGRVVIFPAWM